MSEPTRYTRCWYCDTRFPLREIRAHAERCRGRSRVSFPRIENPKAGAWSLDDTFSMKFDLSEVQRQLAAALREAEDRLEEAVVADWLRLRGYSVKKEVGDA